MRIENDLIDPSRVDAAIDRLLDEMSGVSCETEEFAKMVDQLVKLFKAKEIDANIMLKAFDAVGRKIEQDTLLEIREGEFNAKNLENSFKREELEKLQEYRDEELTLKRRMFERDASLKDAELTLKQEAFDDRRRISSDTLALIAANIGGIVLILGYERVNVIASKAIGFVMRSR
jgi:hypothetical protein